jgi:hypothetical protein
MSNLTSLETSIETSAQSSNNTSMHTKKENQEEKVLDKFHLEAIARLNKRKIDARGQIIPVPILVLMKSPVYLELSKRMKPEDVFELNYDPRIVHLFITFLSGDQLDEKEYKDITSICQYMQVSLPSLPTQVEEKDKTYAQMSNAEMCGKKYKVLARICGIPIHILIVMDNKEIVKPKYTIYTMSNSLQIDSLDTRYNLSILSHDFDMNCICNKNKTSENCFIRHTDACFDKNAENKMEIVKKQIKFLFEKNS